jgi:rod shape-determining protein MreD
VRHRRANLPFAVVTLGVGALLQTTVTSRATLLGAHVDLVLILVVCWAIQREIDEAVLWGLLGGAFVGLFSAEPFGTSVLALGVVAVVASWLNQLFRRSQLVALLILVPISTILYDLLRAVILQRLGWTIDLPATVALIILPGCLVNTLAAPLVYGLLRLVSPRPSRPARYA